MTSEPVVKCSNAFERIRQLVDTDVEPNSYSSIELTSKDFYLLPVQKFLHYPQKSQPVHIQTINDTPGLSRRTYVTGNPGIYYEELVKGKKILERQVVKFGKERIKDFLKTIYPDLNS